MRVHTEVTAWQLRPGHVVMWNDGNGTYPFHVAERVTANRSREYGDITLRDGRYEWSADIYLGTTYTVVTADDSDLPADDDTVPDWIGEGADDVCGDCGGIGGCTY